MKPRLAPISERALAARVSRRLSKDGERLKACKEDSRAFNSLGRYYVVDIERNVVTDRRIDLEAFARKLGVLQAWEKLDREP